jgi:hypothetical protein
MLVFQQKIVSRIKPRIVTGPKMCVFVGTYLLKIFANSGALYRENSRMHKKFTIFICMIGLQISIRKINPVELSPFFWTL